MTLPNFSSRSKVLPSAGVGSAQRLQVVRTLLSTLHVLCSVSLVLVAGFVLSSLQLDLIGTPCSIF